MDDFTKMEMARDGDRQAWSYLYIKYQERILELAEKLLEKQDTDKLPEDLLQRYWIFSIESSEKIMRSGTVDFEAWLQEDFVDWYRFYNTMQKNEMVGVHSRSRSHSMADVL